MLQNLQSFNSNVIKHRDWEYIMSETSSSAGNLIYDAEMAIFPHFHSLLFKDLTLILLLEIFFYADVGRNYLATFRGKKEGVLNCNSSGGPLGSSTGFRKSNM